MADELLDTLPTSGLPVRTLGKFRLERRLGFGAMGEVFLGVHVTLGSCVAIKILLTNLEVTGVFADGHADLTLSRSYEAAYHFRSPSRSRADPRRPDDDQELPCLTYVIVTARGVETTVPPSMRGCHEKPLPARACTIAQVMARARSEGASAEKVAKVTHLFDGSWVVDQGNGLNETFYLRCP